MECVVPPSSGEIVEHLQRAYGISATAVQPLARGADPDAATYRVESPTGCWFVKLHGPAWAGVGVHVAHLLGSVRGLMEVPAPRPGLDDRLVTDVGGHRVVLWPFVDGRDGFEASLPTERWPQLGVLLRTIHDTQVPPPVRSRLRVEDFSPRWRQAVLHRYALLDATVAQDAAAAGLVDLLHEQRPRVIGLVDGAAALVSRIRPRGGKPVLCHGDLHAGNVVIGLAGQVSIVDWDSALLAPRERDLMFPGAGVGGVWGDEQQAQAFLDGYVGSDAERVAPDASAIAYYRCDRIVEDVAVTCAELFNGPLDLGDRQRTLRQLQAQFEPENVVDIAERTLDLSHAND